MSCPDSSNSKCTSLYTQGMYGAGCDQKREEISSRKKKPITHIPPTGKPVGGVVLDIDLLLPVSSICNPSICSAYNNLWISYEYFLRCPKYLSQFITFLGSNIVIIIKFMVLYSQLQTMCYNKIHSCSLVLFEFCIDE